MTVRLRTIPAVVAGLLLCAFAFTSGCREHGTPDPSIRLAVSHEREEPAAPAGTAGSETSPAPGPAGSAAGGMAGGAGQPPIPTQLIVPPMIAQLYSGIRISWKDASNGKSGTIEVPLGGSAPIPDSTLTVTSNVFLPAFTMTSEAITSNSLAEDNPAARITVTDKSKEIFSGWIFTRFPDVHPFQHPRFSLKLEGGVRKASAG